MTTKIAVSLPDELVADARAAVRDGRAASVSAYVASVMEKSSHRETLREVLDDLSVEFGPLSEADRAWARRALDQDLQP